MIESDSECNYVARGMTEEELWKDATEHIVKAHGMKIEDICLVSVPTPKSKPTI